MTFTAAFSFARATLLAWPSLAVFTLALSAATVPAAQVARRIVSDNGDPILYPSYLKEFDGKLCFRANNILTGNNVELWAFDGTVARMAAEINPGPTGSDPSYLAVRGDKLYFCASTNGGANKLWQYDAVQGASLASGLASNASLPQEMFAYGGNLYFRASRFGAPGNIGIELWKFDGATQTPLDLFAGTGSSYPQHFIEYNGLLYFNACGTPGQGGELWRYNGTGMPTEAARIYPNNGSSPENFAVFNGQLYFSAYDGVHGRELWRYDGTTASLAADIVPGAGYSSSNPSGLTVYNGKLYFCATDEVHGYELWAYDGTNAQMVVEINPTPDPGNGDTFLMDSSPANLTVLDGLLYFSANDGVHGRELWSFDGASTRLVLDINPGANGSEVSELTVYNGSLYFSADDGYVPGINSLEPAVFALAAAEPPTLEQALDTTGVVWTTGSHPWLAQTEVTHDGVDAAVSGQVHNADDHAWLKATNLIGPACVTFRWKAQMTCGAFASFATYNGGAFSQSMSFYPTADWQWETFFLGEGPQELLWRTWGNCDDPNQILLWVDEVVIMGPGREAAPFFTTQPADLTVPAGTNAAFTAAAAGYPVPALQWRFQGADIPGATNVTLALTNVQSANAGLYSVVAASALGAITNEAALTVLERAPALLAQPADQTVTHGLSTRFQVAAQGTAPLHYQWRFNGVELAGETNAELTLDPVTANQAGLFSVAISNPIGTTPSREARLFVVRVAAWGENPYGQSSVPSNACEIVAVAAGSGHSLGLRRDGTALAWGDTNWNAQSSIPASATNLARIAAGGWHSLAARTNGTVVAWGYSGDGQTNVPAGLTNAVAVGGGLRHSVALLADGRVRVWGYEPAAQPTVAASLANVASIAVASLHNLALLSNGTVFAWGDNSLKQCNIPGGLTNVVAIAAGAGHSLALKRDGTITGWGTNGFGQLTIPGEATNLVAISAGDQHSLALRADGALLAWGDNRYGQSTIPGGLADVVAVAGGRAHTVALLGAAPLPVPPSLVPFQAPAGGSFTVSLPTVRGRTYFLECKESLSAPDWVTVLAVFGDGTTKTLADPGPTAPQRFYQVRIQE